jgi:hypothetical protein
MRMIFALVAAVSLPVSVTANPLPWAKVGFYGDTEGTVHAVYDSAPGQLVIYVVLRNYSPTDGAGTVRFSAEPPPCFDAVHLSESSVYNVMGDSQAGAWVWPLNCSDGVYLLMTIVYTVQGETWDCCWFEPQPFPGDSQVLAGDCAFTRLEWIATEGIWINPNNPMTCTSPVEETTWGAIKAMYR